MTGPVSTPLWFGPIDRRLFGWLHHPGGRPGAGVVLCYPIGYEVHCVYRTYRVLAEELAAAGVAVLRFDYDGTGDSVGDHDDPNRAAAWIGSVRSAVAELRATGVHRVGVVGMRMGALLATEAVGGDPSGADALVVWDPCISGRRFLRELTMLERSRTGDGPDAPDGSVEGAGAVFSADTVAALRSLDLGSGPAVKCRTLAATRDAKPLPPTAEARFTGGLDVIDAVDQDKLVDVLIPLAAVPHTTVDAVTSWLVDALAGADGDAGDEHLLSRADTAVVAHTADGRDIVERFLHLGPVGLFAIETSIKDGGGPVLLCTNSAKVHHIGQNRLWVDRGREWATVGARVVRLDVSGIGDSPVRPGNVEDDAYAGEAVDDIHDIAAALAPDDPHAVTVMGLCSGAYLAVDVAAASRLRSIVAINPNLNFKPASMLAGVSDDRRVIPPTRSFVRRIVSADLGLAVRDKLPARVWHLLDRLNVHPSPARGLERALEGGTEIVLVYGDNDFGLGQLRERASVSFTRLQRQPRFALSIVDGLDHAMLSQEPRGRAVKVITDHVRQLVAERRSPG